MATSEHRLDRRAAERVLGDLHQLQRELVELGYVRRTDALDAARDAVGRLGDLGSPAAILDRAGAELGTRSGFGRVLVSRLGGGGLQPCGVWIDERDDLARAALDDLGRAPIPIAYPLIEAEVAQSRRGQIVTAAAGPRAAPALTAVLGWTSYVVVAVALHGATVGLLHAGPGDDGREVDEIDLEVAELFADGLAGAFERAVLRETLQRHRRDLQSAIQWFDGRLAQLGADVVTAAAQPGPADPGAGEVLTSREVQVIGLMAGGLTNLAIAKSLVIREGTVKYHVKNILRKLGASSRADAVARYARSGSAGGR